MVQSTIDIAQDPEDDSEAFKFAGLGFGLSVRQKKLADAWLIHGNGTRAAREAGYTGTDPTLCQTASVVLRYTNVRAYIASQLAQHEITERDVRGMLANEAMTAESDGARVRAQELLGKTRGMFSDGLVLRTDALDDGSLARKIAAGDPRLEALILARLRGEESPDVVSRPIIDQQALPIGDGK